MLRALVDEHLVLLVVRLQRRLEGGDSLIDAGIVARVVQHERRLDLRRVLGARLPAVERRARAQIREPDRKLVDDAAAEAEADGADFPGAFRIRFQPARRGHEVLEHLGAVHLTELDGALLVVAREAADRRQAIRCVRDEVRDREPPGDIFDVRIQPAVLVDHQHAGQLAARPGRAGKVAFDAAVALRRLHRRVLRLQPRIVLRHLLRPGVVGPEAFEDGGDGQPADGELSRPVQKRAAVDVAMLVLVKEIQELLRIVGRLLSFHGTLLSCARVDCSEERGRWG